MHSFEESKLPNPPLVFTSKALIRLFHAVEAQVQSSGNPKFATGWHNYLVYILSVKPFVMNEELWRLDLEALKAMYTHQSSRLAAALIEGADWEELNEQRILVTQLSIAIAKKSTGVVDNPAENAIRET
jgi:hypothetical protein